MSQKRNGKEVERGRELALSHYPYVGKCQGDGGSEVGNCVGSFDGGIEGAREGDIGDFNDFEAVGGYKGLSIMLVDELMKLLQECVLLELLGGR